MAAQVSPVAPAAAVMDDDHLPPPPPLSRVSPAGEDPYTEDRIAARAEAAAGALAPTNQHGCFYFSSSEWMFCPMCEWRAGRAEGEGAGKLVRYGDTTEKHTADLIAEKNIRVKLADVNTIFAELKTFVSKDLPPWDWSSFGGMRTLDLTRSQLHNLLMVYGAPMGCLTDDKWRELKTRYPPLPFPYWRM